MANQLVESFSNAAGVALSVGMIVRATTGSRQTLLARADNLQNLANILGVANNSTGPTGQYLCVVGGEADVLLETGLTPVGGQTVYVSASVAGRGTVTPPALPVQVGMIIDASQYSNTGQVKISLVSFLGSASIPQPVWDSTLCRYFFVDNENGNDANVGYIDATPATVFAAGVGSAVALKTSEELRNRLPRYGGARRSVVLFKPRSDNGNYVNKSGANDYLDVGYAGYSYLAFKGSDFSNDANDRVDLAGVTAAVGPNADGSWTASGQVNFVVTNAAGVLPAQDSIAGLKVKYKGNVTPALRSLGNVVLARSADTSLDLGVATVVIPVMASGDEYFLQTPAVKFTTLVDNGCGLNGPSTEHYSGSLIAGMRFTSAVNGNANQGNQRSQYVFMFCRFDGITGISGNGSSLHMDSVYLDETLAANVSIYCVGDFRANATFNSLGNNIRGSAFHASCTIITDAGTNYKVLEGCYSLLRPTLRGLGSTTLAKSNNPALGSSSSFRPSKLVAGVLLEGCSLTVLGIDYDGSVNGIVVTGDMSQITIGRAGAAPSGTTTGAALDMSAAVRACVVVNVISGGGTPDIALADSITKTFASLAGDNWIDANGNSVQGSGGNFQKRLTPGTIGNFPILGADPASPVDGDIWPKDVGGVRTINVRIGGVTYSAVLTP